jgi:predicted DNA-binding transcriptional regulator YafY
MRAEDLFELADMLTLSSGGVPLRRIEETFQCDRQVATRMLRKLEQRFDLRSEKADDGRTKLWRIEKTNSTRRFSIDTHEELALEVAIERLEKDNLPLAAPLRSVLAKLRESTPLAQRRRQAVDLDLLLASGAYVNAPGPAGIVDAKLLRTLTQAILANKIVEFDYHRRIIGGHVRRTVEPHGILYGWRHYLVAFPADSPPNAAPRTFALMNIGSVKVSDRTFVRRRKFDLAKHANQSFGVFQEEILDVELLFSADRAEDAKSFRFHSSQQIRTNPDGSVTVTFQACGKTEMAWELFRWEDKVKIIKPDALRQHYRMLLERACRTIKV